MVGDRIDGHGERAQLILVGAIALAFLIFGIIVVFNSAVYSQTAGQDGTIERAGEPAAVEVEIEGSARDVVGAVNADQNTTIERNESNESNESTNGETEETEEDEEGEEETENKGNETVSQVEDANETIELVNENLTAFENHYRNATAASRPVLADLNLSANESDIGTVVHQREFDDLSGNGSRSVINASGEPYDIERFELVVNASGFEGLTVELGDREVELERVGDNVTVTEDESTCQLEPVPETGENRTVTIDLLNGETDAIADEDCLEDLGLAGSEDQIEFSGEDNAIGTFELVIGANPEDEEIESEFAFKPAVLSVEAGLTYESDGLTYERTREIEIYGDGS